MTTREQGIQEGLRRAMQAGMREVVRDTARHVMTCSRCSWIVVFDVKGELFREAAEGLFETIPPVGHVAMGLPSDELRQLSRCFPGDPEALFRAFDLVGKVAHEKGSHPVVALLPEGVLVVSMRLPELMN